MIHLSHLQFAFVLIVCLIVGVVIGSGHQHSFFHRNSVKRLKERVWRLETSLDAWYAWWNTREEPEEWRSTRIKPNVDLLLDKPITSELRKQLTDTHEHHQEVLTERKPSQLSKE